MPNSCVVINCSNREGKEGVKMFRVPIVREKKGLLVAELTRKRQHLWLAAINRKDLLVENLSSSHRVCCQHFLKGKPASYDKEWDPDWVPSLNLGIQTPTRQQKYDRRRQRIQKKVAMAAAESLLDLSVSVPIPASEPEVKLDDNGQCSAMDVGVQTDLTGAEMDMHRKVFEDTTKELVGLRSVLQFVKFDQTKLQGNNDVTKFYSGLPYFQVGTRDVQKMRSVSNMGQKSKRKRSSELNEEPVMNKHEFQFVFNVSSAKQRKLVSEKCVGAHCSIAGGLSNAVSEAVNLGAKSFALFIRNGRTWNLTPLAEEEAKKFKRACQEHGFPPRLILPHGSYMLNCGSCNPDILQKSRDTFIHELKLCESLGLTLYNFHPGSACGGQTVEKCIDTIAESINLAHVQTKFVKTVIENMSCQGSTVGGKLEELKAIIDRVRYKSRIGVCIDTCHAFAAGYDVSTEEGYTDFWNKFDKIVGRQYLCAMHFNDSKGQVGCHLDRHENIGKGYIGRKGFARFMKDSTLNNIPLILETPPDDYTAEIELLYSLENNNC